MATVPNGQEQPHQQHNYASQDYYAPASHAATHFTYPEPQNMPQYTATSYDTSAYNAEGMRSNIEAQLNAELGSGQQQQQQQQQQQAPPSQTHTHHQQQQQLAPQQAQSTNFMAAFQHQQQQHTPGNGTPQQHTPVYPPAMQHPSANFPQSGPAAWRHFTDNMIIGAPEDYSSHSVSGTGGVVGSAAIAPASFGGMQMPTDGTQAWPLIQYEGKFAGQRSVSGGGAAGE